jgi:hypothetical protein
VPTLASLPQLRSLQLELSGGSAVTARSLSRLTQLTYLGVIGYHEPANAFDPAALTGLTQLQGLHLFGIAGGSMDDLLAALGRLQQLSYLFLEFGCWRAFDASAYSALTASSTLQNASIHIGVPSDAWQHVFAPQIKLPALRELSVSSHLADNRNAQLMVNCCTGLQALTLSNSTALVLGAVQPLAQVLAPLTRLKNTLTSLHFIGAGDASLAVVAQLTGLRELAPLLTWPKQHTLSSGVLALTQLRQLTSLSLGCGVPPRGGLRTR